MSKLRHVMTREERERLEKLSGGPVDWICEDCGSFGYGFHRDVDCALAQRKRDGAVASGCDHPEPLLPIDEKWARCTKCGDDTFPMNDSGSGLFTTSVEPPRPPCEEYARCTVTVGELTVEPAIEVRDDDDTLEAMWLTLNSFALHIADLVKHHGWRSAMRSMRADFEYVWPGRAWFVELHDTAGRWTQSYQPYGVPRSSQTAHEPTASSAAMDRTRHPLRSVGGKHEPPAMQDRELYDRLMRRIREPLAEIDLKIKAIEYEQAAATENLSSLMAETRAGRLEQVVHAAQTGAISAETARELMDAADEDVKLDLAEQRLDEAMQELVERPHPALANRPSPTCSSCGDTHRVTLGDREVMCTRCPVPCELCGGKPIGPYCTSTPCSCACHAAKRPAPADEPKQSLAQRRAAHGMTPLGEQIRRENLDDNLAELQNRPSKRPSPAGHTLFGCEPAVSSSQCARWPECERCGPPRQ